LSYQTIVDELRTRLAPLGFDLVAPLQVGWYNAQVEQAYRLPDFGRSTSLAVIIANTRALWPRFLTAMVEQPARLRVDDPLDTYTSEEIAGVIADLEIAADVRFAYEDPPRRIAIQRLAHAAGLAYLSPTHLCIHETYGPWIGLRAGVTFNVPGPETPVELASPCSCANNCKQALESAVVGSDWRDWLRVRESCPVGQEHRFCDEQIEYHYSKDRRLLRRAVAAHKQQPGSA